MEKIASGWKARWKALYHRSGIQMILSIAFTAVAVVGMLFLGIALLLRFSSSANEVAAENSQRVLAQVNWSLDGYLRNMMRVSDTVYYRVIKNADLDQDGTAQELHDAVEKIKALEAELVQFRALAAMRASALRENLKRRKAQARARRSDEAGAQEPAPPAQAEPPRS